MTTDFSKQIEILGEFYMIHRDDDKLKDFIEFNDLGLPLAYLTNEGLAEVSEDGKKYIAETWEMFLAALKLEDEGFGSLPHVLERAEEKD